MKNSLVAILVILSILLSCVFFSACNTTDTSSTTSDNTVTLSKIEKQICSILIDNISSFNDPSSIKFVTCSKTFYEERILVIRISGTNKFGATVTNDYVMVTENFVIWDAYDYLDYYESGHMPATNPTEQIKQGVFYSFEEWGDPYECEDKNIPHEYFVLYQIVNHAIPEKQKPAVNVSNINKTLDAHKLDMGW